MDVRFWGPQFWASMEFVAFNYPTDPTQQDRKNMRNFFSAVAQVLPCQSCREHFQQLLKDYPVENHLDTREALTKWLVEAHNRVNERLGKPRVPYTVVADKYQQFRGTCEMGKLTPATSGTCQPKKNVLLIVVIVALILGLSAFAITWMFGRNRSSQGSKRG